MFYHIRGKYWEADRELQNRLRADNEQTKQNKEELKNEQIKQDEEMAGSANKSGFESQEMLPHELNNLHSCPTFFVPFIRPAIHSPRALGRWWRGAAAGGI